MGASASTSVTEIQKTTDTQVKTSCAPSVHVDQTISGININASGFGCPINITNKAVASADCRMSTMIDVLARLAQENQTQATAGFGIAVSTDINKTKTLIKNKIEQSCGSQTDIKQNINNLSYNLSNATGDKCGAFTMANEADAKANCVMGVIAKVVDDQTSKIKTTSEGMNLGNLFGTGGSITMIVILIVLLVGAYFAYKLTQGEGNDDDDEGEE